MGYPHSYINADFVNTGLNVHFPACENTHLQQFDLPQAYTHTPNLCYIWKLRLNV